MTKSLDEMFPDKKLRDLPPSDWRRWMLLESPRAKDIRGCVARLLAFAKNQKVLDAEMLSRITSKDNDQFLSAIHELAIGEFLSSIGDINWRPPGRDSRIGEFTLLPKNYEPIFVEVKTVFESTEERKRSLNWGTMREVVHQIASPFMLSVEFTKLECNVVAGHFRPWVKRQIIDLKKELTKEGQQKEVIFQDKSDNGDSIEAVVQFTKMFDNDLPTSCSHSSGGFSDLHERVIGVIDGALSQLPDNQSTLVLVASTEWVGLDENSMIAAMFSLPKVTTRFYTEPPTGEQQKDTDSSIHYELQGIVQKTIRKRLSAVGVWHHKWTPEPSGLLDIYHNPLGGRQIPYKVFEHPKICQLIPQSKGIMEWVPSRPAE
ncbi:MAG: hypothetical protein JXA46_12295 [Dehalococcoidales bacterium]|nr:hypothetical protein [Dehalococcoidales bacterium]